MFASHRSAVGTVKLARPRRGFHAYGQTHRGRHPCLFTFFSVQHFRELARYFLYKKNKLLGCRLYGLLVRPCTRHASLFLHCGQGE